MPPISKRSAFLTAACFIGLAIVPPLLDRQGSAGEREVKALQVLFPTETIAVQLCDFTSDRTAASLRGGKALDEKIKSDPKLAAKFQEFMASHLSEIQKHQSATGVQGSVPPSMVEDAIKLLGLEGTSADDFRTTCSSDKASDEIKLQRTGQIAYLTLERDGQWIRFVKTGKAIDEKTDPTLSNLINLLADLRLSKTTAQAELKGLSLGDPTWREQPLGNGTIRGLTWETAIETPKKAQVKINGHTVEGASKLQVNITLLHNSEFKQFTGLLSKSIESNAKEGEVKPSTSGDLRAGHLVTIDKEGLKREHEQYNFVFVSRPNTNKP